MDIGKRIKQRRMELNMTQDELAEKLNVSRPAVSNWETEKNYPDLQVIVMISDILDISLDDLLKGDANVVEKIAKDTREQRKIFGKKKSIVALTAMLTTVLVIGVLAVAYWLIYGVESYIPYEESGVRITDEGELYVDNPYNGYCGIYSGKDSEGRQIEIFYLTGTFASRTWQKPVNGWVMDFSEDNGEETDENGYVMPIPQVERVYYLSEEYVESRNLLNSKHGELIPFGASQQEQNEMLEEIIKDSTLLWEKK